MGKRLSNYDLAQNELQNAVLHVLGGAPSAPKLGQVYTNSTNKVTFIWNGTSWRPSDAGALTDGSIPLLALAVNPIARGNHTGTQTADTISDLKSTVVAYKLNEFGAPTAPLAMGGQRLTGGAAAASGTDFPILSQVQTLIAQAIVGQTAIKNPARVLAASPITLSAVQTIDGISLAVGDRVLVVGQANGAQNGLYTVQTAAWVRAVDADEPAEWGEGTEILVNQGTVYNGTVWRQTTPGNLTIGTTPLNFTQVSKVNTYTADGVTTALTGMQFSVKLSSGKGITTDGANGLQVDPNYVARKATGILTGDGNTTQFTVTHNLNNMLPAVAFRDQATGQAVEIDYAPASASAITVSFGSPPPNGVKYDVAVYG